MLFKQWPQLEPALLKWHCVSYCSSWGRGEGWVEMFPWKEVDGNNPDSQWLFQLWLSGVPGLHLLSWSVGRVVLSEPSLLHCGYRP